LSRTGAVGNGPEAIATLGPSAAGTQQKEIVMSIQCDVILPWGATPEQLKAVGGALLRWCHRAAGNTGIYQYLDNQALADLIAGTLPGPGQTPRQAEQPRVSFAVRDEAFHNRQATIASLRREIPARGVEDILVDGKSWNLID